MALRYKADIGVGALMVPESRIIAGLLLDSVSADAWRKALEVDNVLQKRSPGYAVRIATLIRARLEVMTPDLWRMVHTGNQDVATHALFAAAIKHSPLLGDFLDLCIREQFRSFNEKLSPHVWQDFIAGCASRDPDMPDWSERTVKNLRKVTYQILTQAGYLDNTRTQNLQRVHIAPEVRRYLKDNREEYVLRCIEVAS